MKEDAARKILKESKTVAVVGLSPRPEQYSYKVAKYLKNQGYKIIPVNPTIEEVLGEKSYPNLTAVPEPVDIVDIFRRPEFVPDIVREAIKIKAKVVWMQEGISNPQAAEEALKSGLKVVQNKCLMKEHKKMFR